LGVPSKFYNILASGRPTVAILGAHSEVARVLEEADCGRRVEQDKPEQLAETLLELLAAPQVLEQMGKNARRVFEEKYTLHCVAEKFDKLFQSAAGAPQPAHAGLKRPSSAAVAE
jgi:glycosyltransferase involved in cell wall biosynthesis